MEPVIGIGSVYIQFEIKTESRNYNRNRYGMEYVTWNEDYDEIWFGRMTSGFGMEFKSYTLYIREMGWKQHKQLYTSFTAETTYSKPLNYCLLT